MKLTELITFTVEENQKEDFRRSIIINNLHRGSVFAKVVIGFELILCIIDITTLIHRVNGESQRSEYLFAHLLMILVNIVLFTVIKKSNILKSKLPFNVELWENGTVIYVTFIMVWGSVISLMDQKLYGQVMPFIVNMITCSAACYLDNKKILIPYSISILTLFLGLPLFQTSTNSLAAHYINLSIFSILCWLISRILYINYYTDFRSKKKLEELSLIDELTGIPNRRSFNNYIGFTYQYSLKKNALFSIIMIDIDYFKQYNDYYGHNAGDKVIISIAQEINSIVRHSMDFAARIGGEEFIYAAIYTDNNEAQVIAEKIRQKILNLQIPHNHSKSENCVTVSLGISTVTVRKKEDMFNCIELADQALYAAKQEGRNILKAASNEICPLNG